MALGTELLERLLNEEESTTLDYKRSQYPFQGTDDVVKSELLKDILAFANTQREKPAYILIGVQEFKGGRSHVVGVDRHLDDAQLQQFVNSKTQRPVEFSYRQVILDNNEIGVIEIPVQEYPIYLKIRFGKLDKEKVYIRRGSSTDVATPEEIAHMGIRRHSNKDTGITITDAQKRLKKWHDQGKERFHVLLSEAQSGSWSVPINDHNYHFSYLISTQKDEVLPENGLKQILYELVNEVRNTVDTGWNMFDPDGASENPVGFVPEESIGSGKEVLERNLISIRAGDPVLWFPEMWRIVPDGRATIVRAYREDRDRLGGNAGVSLSPTILIREISELVFHAKSLVERFESVTKVIFRCSWIGLKDREFRDPSFNWRPYRCTQANLRTTERECSRSELTTVWPTVVAALGCPILRLFGLEYCNKGFVEKLAPEFILKR